MVKKFFYFTGALVLGLVPLLTPFAASAAVQEGAVVKVKGGSTLYYINQGGRFVFPNEKTFKSWYEDFSQVREVGTGELSAVPLRGNVRYRPGALMVKLQTDPKVYVVGANGVLHWLSSETLAKKLYGENWSLLIDDVPDTFFVNYAVGDPVNHEDEFDPEEEESLSSTVADDFRAQIKLRLEKKIAKAQERLCNRYEKMINRIQKRLMARGVAMNDLGEEFLAQCVSVIGHDDGDGDEDDDDDKPGKGKGKGRGRDKIAICHIPPGNPAGKATLIIGAPAAKAHLAHGDTLGACSGSGSTPDTTAPAITGLSANASTTSAMVNWMTNEAADSKVIYATSSTAIASSTAMVSSAALVTNHSLSLSGLTSSTTYYYIAASRDAAGNTATSTTQSFTTLAPVPADTTPPVISGLSAAPSTTSAVIGWATDEPATGRVRYATSTLVSATSPFQVDVPALLTSHSIGLSSLTASTTYFYIVNSTDGSGNAATSTEQTFATTP